MEWMGEGHGQEGDIGFHVLLGCQDPPLLALKPPLAQPTPYPDLSKIQNNTRCQPTGDSRRQLRFRRPPIPTHALTPLHEFACPACKMAEWQSSFCCISPGFMVANQSQDLPGWDCAIIHTSSAVINK